MTLQLNHVKDDLYHTKLIGPLNIQPGARVSVALCNLSYVLDPKEFGNAKEAIFKMAIPKFCMRSGPGSDMEKSLATKSTVQFITCQIEDGEYTAETLVATINSEIVSKFPSTFRDNQICLLYNRTINRVEVRVDGTEIVPQNERATLAIYQPLSRLLGFTESTDRGKTFCFVSIT